MMTEDQNKLRKKKKKKKKKINIYKEIDLIDLSLIYIPVNEGTCRVMVIIVKNGHRKQCSNPGWGCLHFM